MSKTHAFQENGNMNSVAIVGMAGTFNDAPDLDRLWDNLARGHEAVRFLDESELRANGCPPEIQRHPMFVPASAMMREVELFDAEFFGISPAEARMMDPQLRLMLQTAWHAFEDAGIVPGETGGLTGVFAGAHPSSYLAYALGPEFLIHKGMDTLSASIVNGQDFLSTWLSYKLGLNGPSLNIQTACSTGLVAVATACQNLLDYSCDTALAIAGAVFYPRGWGYLSETGSIFSRDGHCRPFDAASTGTIAGEGAGAVVLKRHQDALRDNDRILGLIRGYAINNDGARRAGYTTPSVAGQRALLEQALATANLDSDRISYLETHGTGTQLGDPVEFAALDMVFGRKRRAPCFLGSIKANLGHLGACAGMVGLLKVLLMFKHGKIPPQINFTQPNPEISLENSGFYINTDLRDWSKDDQRIAGISSFGLGGTNCHMILEEPAANALVPADGNGLGGVLPLCLSAKSKEALERLCARWAEFCSSSPDAHAWHLTSSALGGRKAFPWRIAVPAPDMAVTVSGLSSSPKGMFVRCEESPAPAVLVIGDAPQLDAEEISFLATRVPAFALCAEALQKHNGLDMYNPGNGAYTQEALVLAAGIGLAAVLQRANVRVDMIVGVGAGELAAKAALGHITPETALAQAMDMTSIQQSEKRFKQSLEQCLRNGAERFIVIGRCSCEAAALDLLKADDRECGWLPFIPTSSEAGAGTILTRLSSGLGELFKAGVSFTPKRQYPPLRMPLYAFTEPAYRPEKTLSPWSWALSRANSPQEDGEGNNALADSDRNRPFPASGHPAAAELTGPSEEADIETMLATVWCNTLGVKQIQPDDDFFEKGGTSLSAIKIIAEMEKLTGITMQLKDFLSLGTLRRVLEWLEEEAEREDAGGIEA